MNYPSPIKLDQLQVQRDPLTGLFQQNYLLSTLEETLKKMAVFPGKKQT